MTVIQLHEPLEVKTPLGHGWALILETNGNEHYWTVAMDNGALVTFTQNRIRVVRSYTQHRGINDEEMKELIK